MQSVPNIKLDEREELYKMGGEPPNLAHPPAGCRFNPRCPKAMPICSQTPPPNAANPDHQGGEMLALPGKIRTNPVIKE